MSAKSLQSLASDTSGIVIKKSPNFVQRFFCSAGLEKKLAFFLALAFTASAAATYSALKQIPPLGNDPSTIIWLLNLDLVILLAFVVLVARRVVGLWSGRKRGLAGSHLHVRLVYIFSLLAAIPAVVMTVFSVFFFHFGVQTWFSDRVQTAITESQAVASAYLEEHKQVIRADTLAMAGDLERQSAYFIGSNAMLEQIVQTQSLLRNLSEAIVFDGSGRVLARSGLTFTLEFEEIPRYAMTQAQGGEVVIMTSSSEDRVRALVKLNGLSDMYLFVGRMVDPEVLGHLTSTQQASEDYKSLQEKYSSLQLTATTIFVLIGFVLVLSAIWLGLILARQLVEPITELITTADRVRAGDLAARVPKQDNIQELDYLASAFNRMTRQIQEQQNALIEANRQLDRRRKFTESVLTGVSAGVLGVNTVGEVNLANASASELLNMDEEELVGRPVENILPQISVLLDEAHEQPDRTTQGEITIVQKDDVRRTFLVRIVIELVGDEDVGAIVTFDDITDLQSAQRKAAWADVARRIAHEIKNPLTPIQLSAERLKRKYLGQIKEDPETFEKCTDTIVKHVEDIGHMISEFSDFARMPMPVMRYQSLKSHIKDVLVLHEHAHPKIKFVFESEGRSLYKTDFDPQQLRQALNNLIQNSLDSIASMNPEKAMIQVLLCTDNKSNIAIVITDNGEGLPKQEDPSRLTEPYVTRKPKGTGLGLAIVKKIMEDHQGSIFLGVPDWLKLQNKWEDLGGASVGLILPFSQKETQSADFIEGSSDNRKKASV